MSTVYPLRMPQAKSRLVVHLSQKNSERSLPSNLFEGRQTGWDMMDELRRQDVDLLVLPKRCCCEANKCRRLGVWRWRLLRCTKP
eukprot:40322-Eustigmatos_ZCMA.PRE.1